MSYSCPTGEGQLRDGNQAPTDLQALPARPERAQANDMANPRWDTKPDDDSCGGVVMMERTVDSLENQSDIEAERMVDTKPSDEAIGGYVPGYPVVMRQPRGA